MTIMVLVSRMVCSFHSRKKKKVVPKTHTDTKIHFYNGKNNFVYRRRRRNFIFLFRKADVFSIQQIW